MLLVGFVRLIGISSNIAECLNLLITATTQPSVCEFWACSTTRTQTRAFRLLGGIRCPFNRLGSLNTPESRKGLAPGVWCSARIAARLLLRDRRRRDRTWCNGPTGSGLASWAFALQTADPVVIWRLPLPPTDAHWNNNFFNSNPLPWLWPGNEERFLAGLWWISPLLDKSHCLYFPPKGSYFPIPPFTVFVLLKCTSFFSSCLGDCWKEVHYLPLLWKLGWPLFWHVFGWVALGSRITQAELFKKWRLEQSWFFFF